jgi:hypothetical protein
MGMNQFQVTVEKESTMIPGLTLFGLGRKRPAADDLDLALTGAQVGLERKRKQWLFWLLEERRAPLLQRLEQQAGGGVDAADLPSASMEETANAP